MYNLIHKLNHCSFIKRYSRHDDIVHLMPERDKALTDAFRMFSVGMINFAILSAKWPSLRYLSSSILWSRFRFQDYSGSQILAQFLKLLSPLSNALLLTGVENAPLHQMDAMFTSFIPCDPSYTRDLVEAEYSWCCEGLERPPLSIRCCHISI